MISIFNSLRSYLPRTEHAFAAALVVLLTTNQANAQIVGVFGGVPDPSSQLGTTRFAKISGTSGSTVVNYNIPLNGILNYVFYYAPPASPESFLPAGTYNVEYLDANRNVLIFAGTVKYTPNSGFTNGIQVPGQPVNPPPAGVNPGALGIQGFVTKNSGGAVSNTTVSLFKCLPPIGEKGALVAAVKTNGNGFYSFYYTTGTNKKFIAPEKYFVEVSNGKGGILRTLVAYFPSSIKDPTDPNYYVKNATAFANFVLPASP